MSFVDRAKAHTIEMRDKYGEEIAQCIENSRIYSKMPETGEMRYQNHKMRLVPFSSTWAACNLLNGRTAILNFASYRTPGGGFMKGAMAQEEALCHDSFLYNVLAEFRQDYYNWNIRHRNDSFYMNRAIYTPDVRFHYNNRTFWCDVITCAAPNIGTHKKITGELLTKNSEELSSRIEFIYRIAQTEKVDTLILGAFGCGVFGQNPEEVSELFVKHSSLFSGDIIFAVPEDNERNYRAFYNAI